MSSSSVNTLPRQVRDLVRGMLTAKQLEALDLELRGYGMLRMARHLGITKSAAAQRLEAAHLKMRKAGIEVDASGNWTLDVGVASSPAAHPGGTDAQSPAPVGAPRP